MLSTGCFWCAGCMLGFGLPENTVCSTSNALCSTQPVGASIVYTLIYVHMCKGTLQTHIIPFYMCA